MERVRETFQIPAERLHHTERCELLRDRERERAETPESCD